MISPLREVAFDQEWYHILGKKHFWFKWRIAAALNQLNDLKIPLNAKLKVLEIGCGTGILRSALESMTQWTIDGADRNWEALQQSESSRGKTLYYDIFDEHPSLAGTYDVIILYDVLEHVSDTQPFLDSLLKHLAPGGLLLINVPALQIFYSVYDQRMGHVRRYTKKTLAEEFKPFEFQINDMRYWGMNMLPLLAVRQLITSFMNPKAPSLVQLGFRPPNIFANSVLHLLMNVELLLYPKPPIGTSLLMIGRKL